MILEKVATTYSYDKSSTTSIISIEGCPLINLALNRLIPANDECECDKIIELLEKLLFIKWTV